MGSTDTPEEIIRVGIVDDHAITRRALIDFIGVVEGLQVVGEASNGRDAMELARKTPMDVMVLDMEMPGRNGIDAVTHIVCRDNAPKVLVLSGHPPEAYAFAMIKKGAAGYLSKECRPEEILSAIQTVANGQIYLDAKLHKNDLECAKESSLPRHGMLSHREFQIFLRIAQGQSNDQISQDLSLSPKTVTTYRMKVMRKMQARTSSELTYYAIKQHLIS